MKHVGGVAIGKKFIAEAHGVFDESAFCEKPFFIRSRANSRGHWRLQATRDKEARTIGQWMAALCIKEGANAWGWEPSLDARWEVTMMRYAPRAFDTDNLAASFKGIRDGIADVLGTGDGPKGPVTWHYDQKQSKEYGVRIELKRSKPT